MKSLFWKYCEYFPLLLYILRIHCITGFNQFFGRIFNYVRWLCGRYARSERTTLHNWNVSASHCIYCASCIILHRTGWFRENFCWEPINFSLFGVSVFNNKDKIFDKCKSSDGNQCFHWKIRFVDARKNIDCILREISEIFIHGNYNLNNVQN